jgi:hypothetical protein
MVLQLDRTHLLHFGYPWLSPVQPSQSQPSPTDSLRKRGRCVSTVGRFRHVAASRGVDAGTPGGVWGCSTGGGAAFANAHRCTKYLNNGPAIQGHLSRKLLLDGLVRNSALVLSHGCLLLLVPALGLETSESYPTSKLHGRPTAPAANSQQPTASSPQSAASSQQLFTRHVSAAAAA